MALIQSQNVLNKAIAAVATALRAVFTECESNASCTGHRSAHRTDSSCGEPVATTFLDML